MKSEEKKKVAEVLTEKSQWIRIGLFPFRMRPVTLGQIYEMGEYVSRLEDDDLDMKSRVNTIAEMMARYKDARVLQRIFVICLFRSRLMRFIFGRYIRHRLTPRHINKLIEVLTLSLSANFFLTSIIFLRQTKKMTEPSQTTHRGQQSEE